MGAWREYQFLSLIALCLYNAHIAQASQPTVIYLDSLHGEDTAGCLYNESRIENPCKTLPYILHTSNTSELQILVHPGHYSYGNGLLQPRIEVISLLIIREPGTIGDAVFHCSHRDFDSFNDLAFYNADNVTIIGIIFERCGTLSSGVYLQVDYVVLKDCIFRYNTGAGISIYNSRNVLIENCTFADNIGMTADLLANVTSFNYQTYSTGGLAMIFNHTSNIVVNVTNCSFKNNSALLNEINYGDPRPSSYSFTGHGGALLIRFSDFTNNSRVAIENCVFKESYSTYSGASIYISMIQGIKNNTVTVDNCLFESSSCNSSGGAIAIEVFDVNEDQKVYISNTLFYNNSAQYGGGGLNLLFENTLAPPPSSIAIPEDGILTLYNVTFNGNYSPTGGSALGVVSNTRVDQNDPIVILSNCTFSGNCANNQSAVFSYRVPIGLKGTNTLANNIGGCMTITQTQADVYGTVLLKDNSAEEGAALTLEGSSIINMKMGANLTFIGNSADRVGGAIVVINPSLQTTFATRSVFNTACFFQHEVDQERSKELTVNMWKNVTILFANNSAVDAGAAIFATDISHCTYTSTECSDEENHLTIYEKSIFFQPQFKFQDNRVELRSTPAEDVTTAPSTLLISLKDSKVAPGDVIQVKVVAHDQGGNTQAALWSVEHIQLLNGKEQQYFSVSRGLQVVQSVITTQEFGAFHSLHCKNSSVDSLMPLLTVQAEFLLINTLTGEIINSTITDVQFTCCHPGYDYDIITEVCELNLSYPHFLRADKTNRYIYLEPGFYAGYYNDTKTRKRYLSVAQIPSAFQNCESQDSVTGCKYAFDLPDAQCTQNRTGYMCGQCPEGEGVDLTLGSCKKCTSGDAVGLLIIYIFIVICTVLILIFNIGVPNELKGFLFFAQVVGFIYKPVALSSSWDYHLSRLLGFSVYLPICPFTALPALWTAAIGFIPSILATAAVVVYIICARFIRSLSHHTSFDGIWLIFLFVYKYIADTAFNLVKCVKVEGDEIEKLNILILVFHYDGNIRCFAGTHLALAIPSIFLLLIVFLAPAFVILISFRRFNITQPFTDVITEGIVVRHRWWSGFDLIRRLLFVFTITVFDIFLDEYTQLALSFLMIIIIGFICVTKPYEGWIINIIEAAILLDLLVIAICFLDQNGGAQYENDTSANVAIVLLLLPFLYALLIIIWKIMMKLWKRHSKSKSNSKLEKYISRWKGLCWKQTNPIPSLISEHGETDEFEEPSVMDYSLYRDDILALMDVSQ